MDKETPDKVPCSLPGTHDRLNQAFILFQNIKDNYHQELEFTSHLNNLIQTLRNVTFVLQKELAHVDSFGRWYSEQQKSMREDELLGWLIDARNRIVKEGDLKKYSYTKVRLKDHYDKEIFAGKLDAETPMGFVAEWFRQKIQIPEEIKDYSIIEAERIWIVEDMPKTEIIDVLIYCFGVLTNLVFLAHEQVQHTDAFYCAKNKYIIPNEDYMVKLHNFIAQGRIVRILYGSGEIAQKTSIEMDRPSEKMLKKVKERYTKTKRLIELYKGETDDIPFNKISYHVESAKHFMEVDGGILPVVFLYFPDKSPMITVFGMSRPADRYLVFEDIAARVDETRCIAVVMVSEVWVGDRPKEGEKYIPASIQRKGEAISVIAASPKRLDQYLIEILRDKDGKPMLGKETHEKAIPQDKVPSFKKIYDVWRVFERASEYLSKS